MPELSAKDVIDIQVTVSAFDDHLQRAFESMGYFRDVLITKDHIPACASGPDDEWSKWFFRAPKSVRATNTHVRVAGRANQRYALLFRDYLRTHHATAAAYGELKKKLARELRDAGQYPAVKDPAVDLIYFAANEWATMINWEPGPSDA